MAHLGNTIVNGALRVLGGENVDTINGVTVGNSPKFTDTNNRKSFYGTCATEAATAEKVVTLSDTSGWELKAGTIVGVRFTKAANTATSCKLNVNNTGAKTIYYNGSAYKGSEHFICGILLCVIYYMYDGQNWVWMGIGKSLDTKVTQTADDSTDSDSYEVLFSGSANNTTATEGAKKSSRLKINPKYGRVITGGPLIVEADNAVGSYDEGIRINRGKAGYATLHIGGADGSTTGTGASQWWIGCNPVSTARKLWIAQNGSTASATYFGSDADGTVSPYLNLGTSGSITSGNTRAVTGGAVYSFMQPGVKTFQVERGSSFSTSRQGYWAGMLRTDQSGSPTLPIANKWFHVLSMDWGNDSANWVSQLAIGTQEDPNSGVWWRCNNAGGTDISNSTWKHLVEDTQAPPQHSFDFTLTSDNNNKWYKVLSRGSGVPSTSSFKGIITISVAHYAYTNGTTKSFMLQSSYQSMTLYPFDSIEDEVGWLPTWRVSVDSTNMYLEFYVSNITSPAQNPFRITYTSLSNTHSGDPITFYDTLTQSTATSVIQQYTIKSNFRLFTRNQINDIFFPTEYVGFTYYRTPSGGSVKMYKIPKSRLVNLIIWGVSFPAVPGAAVSTMLIPDTAAPCYHVEVCGHDDAGQFVFGYINASNKELYLANRSTSPIYLNVVYIAVNDS